MAAKQVLVVDDSHEIRELLKAYLEALLDVNIVTAENSVAAIAMLQKKSPDLCAAIVDVLMLGYGGTVVDYLRSNPRYENTTIAFYTGIDRRLLDKRLTEGTQFFSKGAGELEKVIECVRKAVSADRTPIRIPDAPAKICEAAGVS
ncbi:two-component system response regulator [Planctomycetota bacterium]